MGYIASNFKKSDYKIVLSEEVYARLLGLINLCGLNINGENDEFGTLIYGNIDFNNTICLDDLSNVEDNKIQSKSFSMTDSMWNELEDKINEGCRVIVHFHTHPFFQDDRNRLYSNEDILFYQRLAAGLNKNQNENDEVIVLGCMASVNGKNISSLDDISFVYYDLHKQEMLYIPSVFVKVGDVDYELKNMLDDYIYGGIKYPINRTLLEVNTEKQQEKNL